MSRGRRLLVGLVLTLGLLGSATGCRQDCPPGTVLDADDGECEPIEQDFDDD